MSTKIYESMIAIMRDMVAVGKDKMNTQQGFKYRGIDDAYNALQPILAKNGVFNTTEVLEKWREERVTKNGGVLAFTVLRIKYTFYAEDGSSVSCIVEGEGMDSGDKSSNKAMAIAHKYALIQTFCVPTELDDPDAQVHEVKPRSYNESEIREKVASMKDKSDIRKYWDSLFITTTHSQYASLKSIFTEAAKSKSEPVAA